MNKQNCKGSDWKKQKIRVAVTPITHNIRPANLMSKLMSKPKIPKKPKFD
jgi:hypothetical protein